MVSLRSLLSQSYNEHGVPHSLASVVDRLLVIVNLYVAVLENSISGSRIPGLAEIIGYIFFAASWDSSLLLLVIVCLCTVLHPRGPGHAGPAGEEAELVDPAPFTYSHRSGKDGAPVFNTASGMVWGTMLYSVWHLIGNGRLRATLQGTSCYHPRQDDLAGRSLQVICLKRVALPNNLLYRLATG